MSKSAWITWDDHRRSRELADSWELEYKVIEYSGNDFFRYLVLGLKTLLFLRKKELDFVICQNPSIVLAALLSIYCRIKNISLIVDRHSNFKIELRNSASLKWKVFHVLSDFSIRHADLTIVTNSEAASYISSLGGEPIVLPDKLPSDLSGPEIDLEGDLNFLFICSFSSDEPVDSVLQAFKRLGPSFHVYVTGNYKKHPNLDNYSLNENIHFLGFVTDEDYRGYLGSVDATIVLTDMAMTLNCGSYESVKAGKPQIVSNSSVIREWFRLGAVYVDAKDDVSIFHGIIDVIDRIDELKNQQVIMSEVLEQDWQRLDQNFRQVLKKVSGHEF